MDLGTWELVVRSPSGCRGIDGLDLATQAAGERMRPPRAARGGDGLGCGQRPQPHARGGASTRTSPSRSPWTRCSASSPSLSLRDLKVRPNPLFQGAQPDEYAQESPRVSRVLTDNGSAFRSKASPPVPGNWGSSTPSPGLSVPRPTAWLSGSSSRRHADGPTTSPTNTSGNAPPRSRDGSITTTGIGPTKASAASHPSVVWLQPEATSGRFTLSAARPARRCGAGTLRPAPRPRGRALRR